jgi:hypothetical protein
VRARQQLLREFEHLAIARSKGMVSPERPTIRTAVSVTHDRRLCVLTLFADDEPVAHSYQDVRYLRQDVRTAGGVPALVERHLGNLFGDWDEALS